jgi:hypothetical protein
MSPIEAQAQNYQFIRTANSDIACWTDISNYPAGIFSRNLLRKTCIGAVILARACIKSISNPFFRRYLARCIGRQ